MNCFDIKLLGLYKSPLVLPLLFDIILISFLLNQFINHYNGLFQNKLFSFILPTYRTLFIFQRFYDFRVFMVKELKDFRVFKI